MIGMINSREAFNRAKVRGPHLFHVLKKAYNNALKDDNYSHVLLREMEELLAYIADKEGE